MILLRACARILVSIPFVCAAQRLVLVDQDGSGPGGSNQMAMMALLQSRQTRVLGITIVTGNAWRDEEVQHTLRMLELIGRTDVPVVPGAVFPLIRTRTEALLAAQLHGKVPWLGAWAQKANADRPAEASPLVVKEPRRSRRSPKMPLIFSSGRCVLIRSR
jgi:inosine-uridine nucleoside N-ribohydrolase